MHSLLARTSEISDGTEVVLLQISILNDLAKNGIV